VTVIIVPSQNIIVSMKMCFGIGTSDVWAESG